MLDPGASPTKFVGFYVSLAMFTALSMICCLLCAVCLWLVARGGQKQSCLLDFFGISHIREEGPMEVQAEKTLATSRATL